MITIACAIAIILGALGKFYIAYGKYKFLVQMLTASKKVQTIKGKH